MPDELAIECTVGGRIADRARHVIQLDEPAHRLFRCVFDRSTSDAVAVEAREYAP